jgi:hypothetical protein
MDANNTQFWVVGGDFRDTAFVEMLEGTGRVMGPYTDRDTATQAWREIAQATRSACNTRFTITEERLR